MNKTTHAAATPEEELETLYPNRDLMIAGESITVREFSFAEGMKLQGIVMPLAIDLGNVMAEEDTSLERLLEVFCHHGEAFNTLLAASINRDASWLDTLNDSDGMTLTLAFWSVNKGFFVRRALMHRQQQRTRKQMDEARDGLGVQLAPESCTPG